MTPWPGASPAVAVSTRPHEISLVAKSQAAPSERDVLSGTVRRVSYMGDAVDYQASVNGSDVALRVTAPPPASPPASP